MTNIERAAKILEIETKLEPIRMQKIFLEMQLRSFKEKYFKNFEIETKIKIQQLEGDYLLINGQFTSLYTELRSYQKKYLVQYKGELFEPATNTIYYKEYQEGFFLSTECVIDTITNGWQPYM